jgi:hypothetical protein
MITKDLEIVKGTTKLYELQFRKDGVAEDITGWTIFFTAKENMKDADGSAKISKTITTHTDATNGKTQVALTATDTALTAKTYYFDIKYKDDLENINVLFMGRIKIIESVTQRSA